MSVMAVERALILLRYITDNEGGLSIREASRNLGYSPATVQKIVNALNAQGYVVQDDLTERYHLGPEAVQLGLTALSRLDVRRAARPYLEELSRESGETAFLAIARGHYAVYVDKAVSDQPIRMDAPLGEDRPYNCTAIGKILLAAKADEDIEELSEYFTKRTEHSIVDIQTLRAEIAAVRENGWAQDREEYAYGVGCIAAPIYDHEGQVAGALTVSGPADRLANNLEQIVSMTKTYADKVSLELGQSEPQVLVGGTK